jgi:hypothetical protein
MKVMVQSLYTTLEQEIRLSHEGFYTLVGIEPYIAIVGAPAGTFTFSILSGATTLFSSTFTSADIKTKLNTANNHAHIYYPFTPSIKLKKGLYKLKLSASSYTPTTTSFISWVQQHENIQVPMDYIPSGDWDNTLTYRIKLIKEGMKI